MSSICLVECGKSKCGHILATSEYIGITDPDFSNSKISTCPKCGNNEFWMLNENGQRVNRSVYFNNPSNIIPTPRMGIKRKDKINNVRIRLIIKGGSDE